MFHNPYSLQGVHSTWSQVLGQPVVYMHPPVQCEPQAFPSAQTVLDIRDGKPGAWWKAGVDMLGRAGLVSLGLYLAGDRENIVVKSLAVSSVIEASVIMVALGKRAEKQK